MDNAELEADLAGREANIARSEDIQGFNQARLTARGKVAKVSTPTAGVPRERIAETLRLELAGHCD